MNINYIKQHCTDLSHDDTIRKKYYRKRFNSLFYIMLGVLFIGVVGMGVMAILSISHNKDYNLIGISCLLPAAFWGVICLHQYAKYDLIIIKQYYREHITQRLINGNWFQRQKEIDRIFFEIRRKSWRDFCTKYSIPHSCTAQYKRYSRQTNINNINMGKNRKKQIVVLCIALVCIFILVFSLFHKSATKDSANPPLTNVLTDSISQIVSACPGEIGVAVIVNNRDTVKVNNKSVYPMMSVFKVHQALALCNDFDNKGISLDTLVNINRDKLDPKTWSPMLKDYSGPVISLTVRDLLRYTLTQSDNNASNLMFKDMVNVAQTDSFIATLIPRSSFQIAYTEEEMSADHNKAYSNYTSPLGAAMLMNRLFTEGLIDDEKQSFIKNTLKECKTGVDRIAAPLLDKEGVVIAHKTGSGYVNENGVLAAHNDVAYICLPNNISYTLAVFVKDFKGNESQASQYVAHISAVVYSLLMQTSVKS